jgi:DNA repair exonuclease SbcCD ATPase subunit
LNNEYTNDNNNLKKLTITKNNYNKYIKEVDELTININIYENVIKLTCAKGIPRQIINGKLQYVENEVNNIITPFINKQIKITKEIEDIKIFIQDGYSKYNSTGGMETFIISIAFKIAFTHTFNLPQTGILFIDEGVSVLDKKHINNFSIISDFIKKYYNHIILITHIDSFFDYTFDIININKNKQKQSSVVFPSITKINNIII